MQYTPKEIKGNVNVSKKSPLKELFSLLSILLGTLIVVYILLGFLVDVIVPHLPDSIEQNLGSFSAKFIEEEEKILTKEKPTQDLLNDLAKNLQDKKEYKVTVIKNKKSNAIALPGRNIVVFSGLLDEVESENELAFVLSHELGHFANKDHLKGLGRGLVFFALSNIFFGQDSSVSNFLGNSLLGLEMKFSQAQEKAADIFAIDLMYKKYKHLGGATDFFEKMKRKEKAPKFFYFFATHPHSQARIKVIQEKIKQQHYLVAETIPLDKKFKTELDSGN